MGIEKGRGSNPLTCKSLPRCFAAASSERTPGEGPAALINAATCLVYVCLRVRLGFTVVRHITSHHGTMGRTVAFIHFRELLGWRYRSRENNNNNNKNNKNNNNNNIKNNHNNSISNSNSNSSSRSRRARQREKPRGMDGNETAKPRIPSHPINICSRRKAKQSRQPTESGACLLRTAASSAAHCVSSSFTRRRRCRSLAVAPEISPILIAIAAASASASASAETVADEDEDDDDIGGP